MINLFYSCSIDEIYQLRYSSRYLTYDWTCGKVKITVEFDNSLSKSIELSPLYTYCLYQIASEKRIEILQVNSLLFDNYFTDDELIKMIKYLYENNLIDLIDENEKQYLTCCTIYSNTKRSFKSTTSLVKPISPSTPSNQEMLMENLNYYKSYIKGFLANIGPMNLDRLYGLVQKFIQGPMKFDYSLDDLQSIMNRMQQEEIIVWNEEGNQYQLNDKK